jgi:hypothetical protein
MAIIKMTEEQFNAGREANAGFCTGCGAERGECEPDADGYPCEECGDDKVQGIENLLVMAEIEIVDEPVREFGMF